MTDGDSALVEFSGQDQNSDWRTLYFAGRASELKVVTFYLIKYLIC